MAQSPPARFFRPSRGCLGVVYHRRNTIDEGFSGNSPTNGEGYASCANISRSGRDLPSSRRPFDSEMTTFSQRVIHPTLPFRNRRIVERIRLLSLYRLRIQAPRFLFLDFPSTDRRVRRKLHNDVVVVVVAVANGESRVSFRRTRRGAPGES